MTSESVIGILKDISDKAYSEDAVKITFIPRVNETSFNKLLKQYYLIMYINSEVKETFSYSSISKDEAYTEIFKEIILYFGRNGFK